LEEEKIEKNILFKKLAIAVNVLYNSSYIARRAYFRPNIAVKRLPWSKKPRGLFLFAVNLKGFILST